MTYLRYFFTSVLFTSSCLLPLGCLGSDSETAQCAVECLSPSTGVGFAINGTSNDDRGARLAHICQRDVCRDFVLELKEDPNQEAPDGTWETPADHQTVYWLQWIEFQGPPEEGSIVHASLSAWLQFTTHEPVETWSVRVTTQSGEVLLDTTREAHYGERTCCGGPDRAFIID